MGKKLDITKKWGGHYKKVPYSRRCDDLHYVPVLLSLPKTERESRGPCHVSFEFHMLDSSPRAQRRSQDMRKHRRRASLQTPEGGLDKGVYRLRFKTKDETPTVENAI